MSGRVPHRGGQLPQRHGYHDNSHRPTTPQHHGYRDNSHKSTLPQHHGYRDDSHEPTIPPSGDGRKREN